MAPKKSPSTPAASPVSQCAPDQSMRPVAVIDIGTTAIRMTIAQIDQQGRARPIEFLQQAVSLGKDTFTNGFIGKDTIEECIQALKSFRRILQEYRITRDDQIRAVATTAVREAINRTVLLDRAYVANGLKIEQLDELDVARLTYHSFREHLTRNPAMAPGEALVTEVGGGSTELLHIQKTDVAACQSYRLGSLRLRETLENFGAPVIRQRALMESDIQRTVDQIRSTIRTTGQTALVALGGDIRFAASRLHSGWNPVQSTRISRSALQRLTEEVLSLSVNELVRRFHLPYPEAETVGPSLLFYIRLAQAYDIKQITVSPASMREGVLMEMADNRALAENLRGQVTRSALEIGHRYRTDGAHVRHVSRLCEELFDALQHEHRLTPWHKVLLTTAALLHDIGVYISTRNHHKHSFYLIQNSELFGLSKRDRLTVALIARYHRRTSPKPTHAEYTGFDLEGRLVIAMLAAILRVADALDRSHAQRISRISCTVDQNRFTVHAHGVEDISLEQLALSGKGAMFEEVYGMSVVLQREGTDTE